MSFMIPIGPQPSPPARSIPVCGTRNGSGSSYGWQGTLVQIVAAALCSMTLAITTAASPASAEPPVKIVALGDSLTAGYGLADKDGFVPRLQAALAAKSVAVEIENAGVSGDTASDGLARLDWSVPQGTDAVIVELGANDMLRGLKPDVTRQALDAIARRLTERHIAVLLCGMRAAPNLGAAYGEAFERIYPELATKYGVPLYPFFLDGVAGNLALTQSDGMHPNPAGVDVIVAHILPAVQDLVARARAQRPS